MFKWIVGTERLNRRLDNQRASIKRYQSEHDLMRTFIEWVIDLDVEDKEQICLLKKLANKVYKETGIL